MAPHLLPFQIAAGLLITAFILFVIRVGVHYHQRNGGWRRNLGALVIVLGLYFGWLVIRAGFGA
jgi:hypothetical protein